MIYHPFCEDVTTWSVNLAMPDILDIRSHLIRASQDPLPKQFFPEAEESSLALYIHITQLKSPES
jgi:hypothetical protein